MKNNQFKSATVFQGLMIVAVALFTACGGGGGGGDDDDGGAPANPPAQIAPQSLAARVVTLQVQGEDARQLRLNDANNWAETQQGQTTQSTYTYERQADGRSATLTLFPPQAGAASTVIALNFSTGTEGTFSYSSGRVGQGTFTVTGLPNDPNPPDDPNNPPNNPPQTGFAPASLNGKAMFGTRTFTSTGPVGQTHVYTFTGTTFHDSDPPEESDGNYTWQPSGNQARLVLNYTDPADFNGDMHDLQMTFTSATQGTFTSTYVRRDGTTIAINGNFEIP